MENSKNLIELLSDDEDDELLQDSSPIFSKKRRTATSGNAVATAAVSPRKEVLTEIGSCVFDLVGIQYYSGTATFGDVLQLVREPRNTYDRNAIRVETMQKAKVGHMKADQAAVLAPILDRMSDKVKMDATISGPGSRYSKPLTVSLYAKSNRKLSELELEPILSTIKQRLRYNFRRTPKTRPPPFAAASSTITPSPHPNAIASRPSQEAETQMQRALDAATAAARSVASYAATYAASTTSFSSSGQTNLDLAVVETASTDWLAAQEELDDMFEEQSKNQLENLPDYPMPAQLENFELFDYQEQGIRWLIHQERNEDIPAYFTRKSGGWFCEITPHFVRQKPNPIRGAILADGMM